MPALVSPSQSRDSYQGRPHENSAAIAGAGRAGRMYRAGVRGGAGPAQAQVRSTGAVFQSHVVASWGDNPSGQLGDGTTAGRSLFGDIDAGNQVAQVAGGFDHSLAVMSDGSVWGWGANQFGQLAVTAGDGPVTRPVNGIAAGSHIIQLSAGGGHLLALRSDGTVLGWGINQAGQLGNGSTANSSGPVPVTGLTSATQVSAGPVSSLAVHVVPFLVGP